MLPISVLFYSELGTECYYLSAHQILLKLVQMFLRYRDFFSIFEIAAGRHLVFWKSLNFIG